MNKTSKKTIAIQTKFKKSFGRGGARPNSGPTASGARHKTVWMSATTLAMLESLKSSLGVSEDQVLYAAMVALADMNLAGVVQNKGGKITVGKDDVRWMAGN